MATKPAAAALFSKADLDPSKLELVASPYGNNAHQLLIIEQVSNRRACWSENGTAPTVVDPLLADFDFTGICGRSTDSNGYSIRMGDQDLGLQYALRVVQRNGDLLLIGAPLNNRNAPEIQIGRTGGVTNGFAKIYLNPGWRITRRVYNNQPLGHFYLTNDQPLDSAIAAAPMPPIAPQPLPLSQSPVSQSPANPSPLPLPVSRPELTFTAGSTAPATPARSTAGSISIPVPPPESIATGSVQPLPALPSANVPSTVPVRRSNVTTPPRVTQSASSSRPATGRRIRVPVPTSANRPISPPPAISVPEAVQPPVRQPALFQPTVPQPVVPQPPISQPQPVASDPKPTAKPGDYVVPTVAF